jgi:transcriptional regulator with XRE-family HTH domain
MKENEPLNKRLERLRRQKGFTAKAMARKIDVAESTYREWEYGRGLKLPPLEKLSQVLAISVTELVTGQTPDLQFFLNQLEELEASIQEIRANLSSRI